MEEYFTMQQCHHEATLKIVCRLMPSTTEPIKSTIIPAVIILPIAPIRITNIGMPTPRPSSTGFMRPPLRPTRILQIANTTAGENSAVKKT